MAEFIQVNGIEQPCNTIANSVGLVGNVRLLNINTTASFLVTRQYANGVNAAAFTIPPLGVVYIHKSNTDLLISSSATANVLMVAANGSYVAR